MNRIEIESLTVEELKEIIAEVVAEGLEDYFSRDPQQDEFLSRKEVADCLPSNQLGFFKS